MKRTPLKRNTKPIRRNSPLKHSINEKRELMPGRRRTREEMQSDFNAWVAKNRRIREKHLKRKPTKRRPEDVNEDFLNWLRDTWPCFVCLKRRMGNPLDLFPWERAAQMEAIALTCGPTEAAHVGRKGTAQRCADKWAMPLGRRHHRHPTDGGGPDSHHAGTRVFWEKHDLIPKEVFELLHRLYREETGRQL